MNVHPKTILSMLLTGFLILGNVNRAKAEDKVLQTPTILAESHFESGLEGWTVFNSSGHWAICPADHSCRSVCGVSSDSANAYTNRRLLACLSEHGDRSTHD